jgi:precorrin-4/cobalt-precorrin-4 C11-methyltransferase
VTDRKTPCVTFVGAGPGDPDLITVKGKKFLETADMIIYAGSLVPEALLQWAKKTCECHNSASMTLEEIVTLMERGVRRNGGVVRLHTGDPSLYGAIHEQMAALDERGISYQVVPGVTAAFAAAAAMKIEYTLPEETQTLILTRIKGRTPVPETESLRSLASHKASMAIYLSISHVKEVSEILSEAYGPDAVCAVAFRVSQPGEKIFYTPVKSLEEAVKKEGVSRQALIIVGKPIDIRNNAKAFLHQSKLYDPDFSHGFREA